MSWDTRVYAVICRASGARKWVTSRARANALADSWAAQDFAAAVADHHHGRGERPERSPYLAGGEHYPVIESYRAAVSKRGLVDLLNEVAA